MRKVLSVTAILFFLLSGWCAINSVQGAETKPIELKIMHPYATDFVVHKDILVPWAKMLEERTGGRVKSTIYPSELLGKGKDAYDLTISGIADICWSFIEATPGRFPLTSVYQLPFTQPDTKIGTRVINEHFGKEPALKAEFRDVKMLWLYSMIPVQIHTVKTAVRRLEDLKGMKVRTVGGVPASTFNALGAVPVVISPADMYTSLERGTVDGTMYTWSGIIPQGVHKLTKYHTVANLFGGAFFVTMNKKRWESFPPDIQKIIDDISGFRGGELTATGFQRADLDAIEKVKQLGGHEIIELSPAELERWKKSTDVLWDEWLKGMNAKGLPGKKILDDMLSLTKK